MKQIIIPAVLVMWAACGFAQSKSGTYTGEIMDKQCAQMGSHENMMKAEGATNAKECALKCAKDGDKFVLFDSSSKKVYPIEDEKKVREFAGQRVQITGSYDDDADVLHVKSISAAK